MLYAVLFRGVKIKGMVTNGKWIARIGDFAIDVVEEKSGFGIVHIGSYSELKDADYPIETAKDNAILIAASPDMYEALKAIKDYCKYHEIRLGSGIVNQVETAIAKAEGRTA